MALLTHPCVKCGHGNYRQQNGRCACGCQCTPDAESVVKPTFDVNGRKLQRIIPPGEKVGVLASHGCDGCKALYAQAGV